MGTKIAAVFIYLYVLNVILIFPTAKSERTIHCLNCKDAGCDETNTNTYNLKLMNCVGFYKCATFKNKNGKVTERKCLQEHESNLCSTSAQCCDGAYCNIEGQTRQICYGCKGKDCSDENLKGLICQEKGAQCFSITFPTNHSYYNDRIRGCLYVEKGANYQRCVQAATIGGTCRRCKEHFCNSKENDGKNSDAIPSMTKKSWSILKERKCYGCLGKNCTSSSSNLDLEIKLCGEEIFQCISLIFPENSKDENKNIKGCYTGDNDDNRDMCADAAKMGGFCKICSSDFCNSLQNDHKAGDTILPTSTEETTGKSIQKSTDSTKIP